MSIGYLKKDSDMTTVYIGNLVYSKNEKSILNLFKSYGYVNFVRINRDKKTKKSKGIAFVQMKNRNEALKAIKALNGKQLDGRTLKVSIALENNKPKKNKRSRR